MYVSRIRDHKCRYRDIVLVNVNGTVVIATIATIVLNTQK